MESNVPGTDILDIPPILVFEFLCQVFCSAFSSLLSIFHSRSRTAESLGPSALACLEHRLPSVFVAFTETSEKILLLSCNLSVFLFSGQYQLAVLGLCLCLTCLFSNLIKENL